MSARVVIPQGLRASETLQEGVRSQDHVLNLLNTAVLSARDRGDILHDPLRRLGLARARLPRDDHALILMVRVHVVVCALRDREDMWRYLQPVLALVPL